MDKLTFATGNKDKLREAERILNIKLHGTNLEIDEIQSLDGAEVAIKKARAYFNALKRPLFSEDSIVVFKALKPLPGPYIKDFWKALGNGGLCNLLEGKSREVVNEVIIVFIDKNGKEYVFSGKTIGQIAHKPKGKKGWGWDPIFVPDGSTKTYGEMEANEKNKYSARQKAFLKFSKWLQKEKKANFW